MNISQIFSDIDLMCGSTSATYLTADKLRNINIHYADVARLIWDSAVGWNYNDSTTSSLSVAKVTLTNNQNEVLLPTTAQRIQRVEVKDRSGTWTKLEPIDIHDTKTAMPELYKGGGMPLFYDLFGRSANLYPAPLSTYVTLTSGIAFYIDKDVTNLSATSATPGFATPFHRILSLGAAVDFIQDDKDRQVRALQKARLEEGLVRFYGKRMVERPGSIVPAAKGKWRRYL